MKYFNAQVILPDALVKELQTYVQGDYIYVPVEQEQQKRWGEVSGYRQELEQRNQQIKRNTKTVFPWSAYLKNIAYPYMLFGKSYIKSNRKGLTSCSLLFYPNCFGIVWCIECLSKWQ